MKKTFIFGLMAAALGFTACSSEDDLMVNNNHKGMVLRATVEQTAESRATFTDVEGEEGVWQFAFETGDNVCVTNMDITPNFYTFTNEGTEFKCEDAKAAASDITWSAYFPSNEVSLVGQTGAKADVANKYALAGQSSATTGEEGLSITMSPKVAILVIKNYLGEIDINVKNSATTWVSGMTANTNGFDITTKTTKQSLLSVTIPGVYYIAVPAGVQLAIKNGDDVVKSTGTNGLSAGKYYKLSFKSKTVPEGSRGKAYSDEAGSNINWLQLWEGGPKYAECNVGTTSPTGFGDYFTWGGIARNGNEIAWTQDPASASDGVLTSDYDTATHFWGANWRTPTPDELEALAGVELEAYVNGKKCIAEWIDGKTEKYENTSAVGLLCTGVYEYSSNSVFLPAAGVCTKKANETGSKYTGTVSNANYTGYYWSNSPVGVKYGTYLFIRGDGLNVNYTYLFHSNSVRPVLND